MSVFYDLASLVLVPSGYKASKVYAQKPLTTDGQLAFSRASTATRVNSAGLIETVASNVPRLDYQGSTCPKLLLEPQRTNLATYSEQFDDAAWTKSNSTITANDAISPDGFANADKLVEDTSTGEHLLQRSLSLSAGAYTWGVFAKAAGRKYIVLRNNASGGSYRNTCVDLELGTVVFDGLGNAQIQNFGNGWFRITANSNETSVVARNYEIHLSDAPVTTNGAISYTGNGASGILLYGAQVELGAYATSYVKTEAATVTRLADAASKTGISSLIGQTEGTIFLQFVINADASRTLFSVDDGSTSNYIAATTLSTSQVRVQIREAGAVSNVITSSALTLGSHKIAIAYKSGDYALYIDGVQAGVSTSTAYPVGTLIQFVLNNSSYGNLGDGYSQALLFKTRLTNAQLAELTSL